MGNGSNHLNWWLSKYLLALWPSVPKSQISRVKSSAWVEIGWYTSNFDERYISFIYSYSANQKPLKCTLPSLRCKFRLHHHRQAHVSRLLLMKRFCKKTAMSKPPRCAGYTIPPFPKAKIRSITKYRLPRLVIRCEEGETILV